MNNLKNILKEFKERVIIWYNESSLKTLIEIFKYPFSKNK